MRTVVSEWGGPGRRGLQQWVEGSRFDERTPLGVRLESGAGGAAERLARESTELAGGRRGDGSACWGSLCCKTVVGALGGGRWEHEGKRGEAGRSRVSSGGVREGW